MPKNILQSQYIVLAIGLLLATIAFGQTKSEKAPPEGISAEIIQARLKQIEDSHDLDDAAKTKIREYYQQAIRELESGQSWLASASRFEQMTASAANDLAQTKKELAELPSKPSLEMPDKATLTQIDQNISKQQSELDNYREKLVELEAEPKRRASRRAEIPKLASSARDRIAQLDEQLQATQPADEATEMTASRRALVQAQRRLGDYEVQSYEKEIAAYEATAELLPLRRDLYARRVALLDHEIKYWRETANQRRRQEAENQVQQARLEAARAHPAVRRLAHENAALAEMRKELAQRIADSTQQYENSKEQLTLLKDQFKRTREKVEAGGLTNAIGLLLRKQRETLPNIRSHRSDTNARQATIREVQLALLQLQERRNALGDLEQPVRDALKNLNSDTEELAGRELENAVRESLQTEKKYLDGLIGDYNIYFDKLVDLDNAERQLIREIETYATYIDERVLWIASAPRLTTADASRCGEALWKIAGPDAFWEISRTLALDAMQNPAVCLLAIIIFGPLIYYRRRIRDKIQQIGDVAEAANCYRLTPTVEALLLTLLMAAIWPGFSGYISWRLMAALDASEFCKAMGAGLATAARVYFALEVLTAVCRPNGLGEAHMGWPSYSLKLLRQNLKWLKAVILPLVLIVATLRAEEYERWNDSLGRLCFLGAMLFFALFLERILRPDRGMFKEYLALQRGGWMYRLRFMWYPAAVCLPLFLASLAVAGYYYTSQQLAVRMVISIYLLVGLILLRSFLLRWVLVNRRKLSIAKARRRAAMQLQNNFAAESSGAPSTAGAAEKEHDLAAINSQTRRLVEYSLAVAGLLAVWFIWIDVLPALGILNRVNIWTTTVNVTESVSSAESAATTRTVLKTESVTLAHLSLAILALATTLIAAKNIPGLLEMAVLQHLPVDAGVRYAVATVSRYLITIFGIVFACNTLGLGWSKVQWLLAAISVGLGFGLQEIFANFVSGLIILIERPIRVGDVITIGEVTGSVSRIRMRATTILDPDRKELIIPNKDVITGRVLNWTLSDQVNRVQIKVGIAYGADTQAATEIMLRAAKLHPHVLDDPQPGVTFESFGSSALGFVLCCYLPNLEYRSKVIHELHIAIDRAFRESGIEIAYPQQDIHLRSMDLNLAQLKPALGTDTWPPMAGQRPEGESPTRHVA
ncbi:MAG TPA: mechanosensitive ion channel domain-containing protein [Thermoguttaceae bacterium]